MLFTPPSLVSARLPVAGDQSAGMVRSFNATSLWSDDAPAKLVELFRQVLGEACPRVALFFGKFVDLPGDVFWDVEGDVAVVAPLTIFWYEIEQEVGDLA